MISGKIQGTVRRVGIRPRVASFSNFLFLITFRPDGVTFPGFGKLHWKKLHGQGQNFSCPSGVDVTSIKSSGDYRLSTLATLVLRGRRSFFRDWIEGSQDPSAEVTSADTPSPRKKDSTEPAVAAQGCFAARTDRTATTAPRKTKPVHHPLPISQIQRGG